MGIPAHLIEVLKIKLAELPADFRKHVMEEMFDDLDQIVTFRVEAAEIQILFNILEKHELMEEFMQNFTSVDEDGVTIATFGEEGPVAFLATSYLNNQKPLSNLFEEMITEDKNTRARAKVFLDKFFSDEIVDVFQEAETVRTLLNQLSLVALEIVEDVNNQQSLLEEVVTVQKAMGKRPN